MWEKLRSPLPEQLVRALHDDILAFYSSGPSSSIRHFDTRAKKFFSGLVGARRIIEVLSQPVIRSKIDKLFENPVVQHGYPVIKPAGGPPTYMHQDHVYWEDFDDPVHMHSFWVALENIPINSGCLIMGDALDGPSDQVLPHQTYDYGRGDQAFHVQNEAQIRQSGTSIPVRAGEVIMFNSVQVHGAFANTSSEPRIAMKIAVGERRAVRNYAFSVANLSRATFAYFSCRQRVVETAFRISKKLTR